MKFLIGLSFLCCLLSADNAFALNKCVDEAGRVLFQDQPCSNQPASSPTPTTAPTRISEDPVLHAISVYGGNDPYDDGRPWRSKCGDEDLAACRKKLENLKRERGGVVTLNISITDRPVVLALSGYEKITWYVKTTPGVLIEKVILSGYHAQAVEGISPETRVEIYTNDKSTCKGNCIEGEKSFFAYKSPPAQLQEITGLELASWQGSYQGEKFSIYPGIKTEIRVAQTTKTTADKPKKKTQTEALNRSLPKRILNKNYDGEDFENIDFSRRQLQKSTFNKANLKGANFKGIGNFQMLSFKNADLSGADFSNTSINQVDFSGANLSNANFNNSHCINCRFDSANLTNATFRQTTLYKTSFDSAELKSIEFTIAVWSEVDLSGARNVNHAQLYAEVKKNPSGVGDIIYDYNGCAIGAAKSICRGMDLSGHKFFAKQLSETDFSRANLANVDFSLTRLLNSNFTGVNLSNAIFGKHVWQTNFSQANLTNADFRQSVLQSDNVNFARANLRGLQFVESATNAAVFANANLKGCSQCQAMLNAGTVDFDALHKFITEYESPSAGTATTSSASRQMHTKLALRRDYIALTSGQAVLSTEQYIELIRLMLKSKEPLLLYDSMNLIKTKSHSLGPDNICNQPKMIAALLPLISLSSEAVDARVKRKQAGKTPSEYIRSNVVNCLAKNIPKFKRVSQIFRQAYKTETINDIKSRLMLGYRDNPKQLEAILQTELPSKNELLAKQAAILLRQSYTPSPELVATLISFFESDQYTDVAFYKALENFVPAGQYDIARFQTAKNVRKSQKWNTTHLDMLIRHFQRQAKNAGA
jgi:uncharacterized protein YjbI with pentapeptide repeats